MGQVLSCTPGGQRDLGGGWGRSTGLGGGQGQVTLGRADASCSDPQSSWAPRRDSTSTTRTPMGECELRPS